MIVGRRQRAAVWAVTFLLWATGTSWWLLARLAEGPRELDSGPWRQRLIAAHGLGAILFAVLLGTLIERHVRRGWRARANRPSGAATLAAGALLALSGWALYYTGDERWREWTAAVHRWGGLVLPALLVAHVLVGRLWRRRFLARRGARRS